MVLSLLQFSAQTVDLGTEGCHFSAASGGELFNEDLCIGLRFEPTESFSERLAWVTDTGYMGSDLLLHRLEEGFH
jgi:hypothetical protein